ncbi:Spermidine synthase [Aquisphaera giovannonii]|uniref:Spermidine synthase n=1 Tax=Aquisphaera giovannonii TaxID=406548 RepID=A0A5B9W762_9BACT|nr:Spermidine synthase [Aquisphaera giovannonii]
MTGDSRGTAGKGELAGGPGFGTGDARASSPRRASAELFLVSFLVLFHELACIRWFGATVVFLTFFTNLVLMASFLGVSVGCLAARRGFRLMNGFAILAATAVAASYAVLWLYARYERLMIDVGGQQSPQLIFFGTDARVRDISSFVVPIEVVAGAFFVLIALAFVGLGQEMGRRFDAIPNRIAAYTSDILGSLMGIVAFGLVSVLQLHSVVWFGLTFLLALPLVRGRGWRALHVLAAAAALLVAARVDWPRGAEGTSVENTWSPYYLVSYKPGKLWIDVNNLNHQGMQEIGGAATAYRLPYRLNRDSGGGAFDDVLIIGAGSGNDVSAALLEGAGRVDAVEIDPVINAIGRRDHPNRPFDDPRVRIHLDDGRSFVRRTDRAYDLVVYALVDSLVLHSGYSSLRLESFLFTEQAFRDIKARLKPGGVFALYNYYRQGWVVGRIERLAEKVFGTKPVVISLPYQSTIRPSSNQRGYITFLLIGNTGSDVVERIRGRFAGGDFYWMADDRAAGRPRTAFGAEPPGGVDPASEGVKKIGPASVDVEGADRLPTDDWPFLYLREPRIPGLSLRGMAIVGVLSTLLLLAFAPVRSVRPDGRMFFLGAGFMLLETKGVVHMALLFGSTWVVNSVVFAAILCMILLSNVYVLRFRPRALRPYYALLILFLAVNSLVPMTEFLALAGAWKTVVSCVVVFVPVFFAGVIFAASFRDSRRPDVDFGSNIGGVIVGGLSENLSVVGGFQALLWLAIVYYLLSAVFGPKGVKGWSGSAGD